jgi:hypothetical protein
LAIDFQYKKCGKKVLDEGGFLFQGERGLLFSSKIKSSLDKALIFRIIPIDTITPLLFYLKKFPVIFIFRIASIIEIDINPLFV